MFKVDIYINEKGESEVLNLLFELKEKINTSKESRIKYERIVHYIKLLEMYGTQLSEKTCKNIESKIWELRPGKIRLLFTYDEINQKYLILNYFVKKTNKTPKSVINKAQKIISDYYRRTYEKR